jgi:PAS domain S-box-containing protein
MENDGPAGRAGAEERIAQLDRARTILTGIDRAIIRIPDRQKLLDEVCRVAVEVGGFKLAWVGMVAPDGSVEPVARAGAAGYLEGIRVVTGDEPEGRGPSGTAIRENRPVVIEETDRDPRMIPWHARLRQFELRYCAAFPIRIAGKVAGSFQVYAPKAQFFDEQEVGLLTQMSDDVSFALTAICDLAARKQAEDELHEASELNRQMIASAKDGISVFDREFKYLVFNPAMEKITSTPASEVLGRCIFEAFPFLQETGLMKRLEQTLAGETCAELELLLHPPHTGRPIWISDTCSALRNAHGEITGGMSIVRDITERKGTEDALGRSETKFRTLYNSTCEAVMLLDAKGFFDCNPATLAVFGCATAEEFLSMHPADFSPMSQPDGTDSRTLANRQIARAMEKGSCHFEWLHKRADTGAIFPADVLLSAMELDGKRVLQATVRDITERKRAEERIAKLNRARAILAGIDRAIVRIPDRQKLLDEVCRVAVESGGFKLAWVGMVAPDGTVQPVARAGATGYLDGVRVVAGDEPEGRGPTGTAIRENRPVVIEEADRDPRMIPWHDRLRQFGLRYIAAFPIHIAGKVTGSLQVYAPTAHFFDEHELGLLTQMSDDVSFALTAISDLAARRQAEDALHDAVELNRQMIAGATDGILVYDCDLKCLIWNAALEKLTETSASQVLGKRLFDVFPFLLQTEIKERIARTLAGQPCHEVEILLHPPHLGRPVWISDTLSAIRNARGEIIGGMSIIRDITARKQAEAALHEASELNRQMIASAKDGISVFDREMKYLVFNPAMEKITSTPASEVLGKRIFDAFPFLQATDLMKRLEQTLAGETCAEQEVLLHPPHTGRPIWISDTCSALRNARGEIVGGMSIIRDITDRKQAEGRIAKLSRVQTIMASIDRAIVHIGDRQKLLDEICRVAVEEGGFKLAWVGMAAPDGTVRPVAKAGATEYLDSGRVVVHDVPEGHGPTGTAIRENRPVVVEEADQDPRLSPWHEHLRKFGMRYIAAFPIRIAGKVVGAFQVYAPQANFFNENEVRLLTQVSNDVSFALTAISDLAARKLAEEAMRRSEHNLTIFFNQAPVGLVWLSADGLILRANQAQLDLLGCPAQGYLGHSFTEACVEPAQGSELLERLAARKKVRHFRLALRCKDGTVRHLLVDAVSFLAEAASFWKDSHFRYSSIFLRDITDMVKLEREILQAGERESRRIAQDLHDGLGQLLAGTAHMAATLQKDLAAKSRPEARRLDRISKLLCEAIAQARSLSHGLHPVEPESNGLMAALEFLAARTKSLFQTECHFTCRQPVLIPDNAVATHLFRIAQEAVSNAVKHGRPRRIEISLTGTPERIQLAIRDNGAGLPARLRKNSGMGLRIMQYRAGMINGSLAIQNESGGGAAVVCTVPLPGAVVLKRHTGDGAPGPRPGSPASPAAVLKRRTQAARKEN